MSADFSVRITVRNGRLLSAIRAKYGSASNMSRLTGISVQQISALLTMRQSPLNKNGEWSLPAYDISSALLTEPEQLWPAHVARIRILRNEAEIDMNLDDVQDMLAPDNYGPAMKALARWAKHVSPRHMRALVMQSSGATLDEIAKDIGVNSRERARQMANNAARKIRIAAAHQGITKTEQVRM